MSPSSSSQLVWGFVVALICFALLEMGFVMYVITQTQEPPSSVSWELRLQASALGPTQVPFVSTQVLWNLHTATVYAAWGGWGGSACSFCLFYVLASWPKVMWYSGDLWIPIRQYSVFLRSSWGFSKSSLKMCLNTQNRKLLCMLSKVIFSRIILLLF